jgi:choline dehydrogenase
MLGVPGMNSRGFYPGFSRPSPSPNSISWSLVKLSVPGEAHSDGTVTLRSTDPRDVPTIVFNRLQGEDGQRDLLALTEATQMLDRMFAALPPPFDNVQRDFPTPGMDIGQGLMDEAFGHHASASCRMGPPTDPVACVDSKLRVRGVDGLRVVDASIFPYAPGGYPFLSVYMMGLKAAHEIATCA